ncbi:tetratricopeptide repeat protein [Congregibacter variabilis]|uniref:Ancillary SecYEG translocon subunit n=1 Tax=Congregibacter variabilis TaxID=3081200 RepID=A0ABZ0I2Q3_9GAMM|nr:tetratricopeptide repeat protein [Congregibacter sp. IMCC43200]
MESYRSEEEQVEALKRWWKENGRSTMLGIALALGLGFGWQAWQKNQELAAQNASNLYQQMLQALSAEEDQTTTIGRQIAQELKDNHRGTVYAQFAALHLARLAVNDGQPQAAEQELRWALAMADGNADIQQVAQLRLARILASLDKHDEALGLLEGANSDFAASYAIARGDILLSQGMEAEAFAAYESAMEAMDASAPIPQTLQDKLEYLGARLQSAVAEAS